MEKYSLAKSVGSLLPITMAQIGILNFSDVPEMLPGARPGANPSQRAEFERRSRQLHERGEEERTHEAAVSWAASGAEVTSRELEEMFPMLEPSLVRSLRAEATSAQRALEMLIAISADTNEPVAGSAEGTGGGKVVTSALPQLVFGVEDHDSFPLLVGADGWQVPPARLEAQDDELGSIWRDRAKAAADKPAPQRGSQPPAPWGPKKKKQGQQEHGSVEQTQPLTDYECRHRAGERRAKQKAIYGRSGRGSGNVGCGRSGAVDGDCASEGEEEIDCSQV